MKKNGGISTLGMVVIAGLIGAILWVGAAALASRQEYRRAAAITPTPSITPRTVRITEDPAYPTSTPTPRLFQMNSVGVEVQELQTRLRELGYYAGEVDGQFGGGTRGAVEAFQRQHGLDADGIAGEKTLRALYSDSARQIVITPTPEAIAVLADSLPLLVNKDHPIDKDFVPADLVRMSDYCDSALVKIKYKNTQGVREAVDALMDMLAAAKEDGVTNWQVSAAYRSYKDQQDILESNVKSYMEKNGLSRSGALSAARKTVADPGTSEHHTGLAFDMTVPNTEAFISTPQCKWLHAHCWDYGFIVRYQKDKEDITGFLAEAWHIRYVGVEHSRVMQEKNLCLEEYLDLASPQ